MSDSESRSPASGVRTRRRLLQGFAPLLAVLPLLAYVLVLFVELREVGAGRQGADLVRIAETLSLGIESELTSDMRALETLAGSIALERRDLAAFREEARRLLAREPIWQTVVLVDGDRQVMNLRFPADATPPASDLPVVVASDRRSEMREMADGRILLTVPLAGDAAHRPVLVAVVESGALAGPIARVAVPAGWSTLLVNREARLLAGGATLSADAAELRAALAHPGQLQSLRGAGEVLVHPVAETGWSVLVVAPDRGVPWSSLPWLAGVLALSLAMGGGGAALALQGARRRQDAARRDGAESATAAASVQERRRSDLLSTVSHELRAPLTGLLGYTDLLLRAELPAQARGWVEQQKRAGEVLLALIGDVLDLARLDEGEIALEDADLDLPDFLEGTGGLMRALAAQKGLKLTVSPAGGLPRWVKGDPLRLRQIVTNLLSNAIKFTASGEVTLAARLVPGPDRLEISVADTGMGIPPAELPRIFERFRQAAPDTARRFGGSGLGLSICRRLASAMGGTITAESEEGHGSRFVLTIPFRPGAAPRTTRLDGALRLLVAEDVPASRLLLKALLERQGHEVTAVEDGARALAVMHGQVFDLGLLDLQMPEVDGMAVAAAIRRMPGEVSRLPLIALTADPPEEIELLCREAGFDAVLRKPFETRRLMGLIEALRGTRGGTVKESAARAA